MNLEELVKDLNVVVQKMYGEDDSIVAYARELLAVLRKHGVGE